MPVATERLLPEHRYDSAWREAYVARGLLPSRYLRPWATRFEELLTPHLAPGMAILDVGSGREPILSPEHRPELHYVGLDISRAELRHAPPNAYDAVEVGSITECVPQLAGAFDVVLSYQALEHVESMEGALKNIATYLKPGGVLVALLSGRYSPMALINRLIPHAIAVRLNQSLVGRAPESMFEARYDRCYSSALRALLDEWSEVEIEPRWEAANYFDFASPVLRLYVAVENRLASGQWEDLATHYFLRAAR